MRLSGRSGLTQAGTDTRVFFSGGQPYARITNHGHSILGEEEGTAIDLGATFVNSSIPTHGANLETLVAEITYHENPERPWRVISARESGLPYDGVAMPVERVFRSFVEQRNGSNHPDRCLKMSLIPSGTKRRALYDHIGLDPEPIHVHGDRPRDAASQAVLNKKQGLVISASQAVELPQSTGLVIQHAVYEDADGKRLITHLNSPLLKSHNRRGFAYTHTIMYETDGTPTYVIGYAFDRFSYA